MDLDSRIKEIRHSKKISLNRFERETGISKVTLMRYERGEIPAAVEYLFIIADYFEVSLDELFVHSYKKPQREFAR